MDSTFAPPVSQFGSRIPNAAQPAGGQGLVLDPAGRIASNLVNPGRGTTFPTAPPDGYEYHFVADSVNGIVWRFKYNAGSSSASKWECIGGMPLVASVVGPESTSSTTYVALATASSIVAVLAGDYFVYTSCEITRSGGTAITDHGRMSYDIGGTGAVDADSIAALAEIAGTGLASSPSRWKLQIGLAASTTLTTKFRAVGGGTLNFGERTIMLIPRRVT